MALIDVVALKQLKTFHYTEEVEMSKSNSEREEEQKKRRDKQLISIHNML